MSQLVISYYCQHDCCSLNIAKLDTSSTDQRQGSISACITEKDFICFKRKHILYGLHAYDLHTAKAVQTEKRGDALTMQVQTTVSNSSSSHLSRPRPCIILFNIIQSNSIQCFSFFLPRCFSNFLLASDLAKNSFHSSVRTKIGSSSSSSSSSSNTSHSGSCNTWATGADVSLLAVESKFKSFTNG